MMMALNDNNLFGNFTYEEAVKYIESTAVRGSHPGLDRIRALSKRIGNPQESLRVIHVAGTNGKGSVCAFLASILTEAGYRVGRYNSPSLTDVRDHYRIGNDIISCDSYADCVTELYRAEQEMESEPTQFEIETALAFLYFKRKKCDFAIIECGMGGRDDATNIVTTTVLSVITSISLDHCGILGHSTGEIAENKAGIIKRLVPTVMLESSEDAVEAVRRKAYSEKSPLTVVRHENITDIALKLAGYDFSYKGERLHITSDAEYQIENAALAYEAAMILRKTQAERFPMFGLTDDVIVRGLSKMVWPFRFERISATPEFYIDGAHNPDAAAKLAGTIQTRFAGRRPTFIMGVFADKDYDSVAKETASLAASIHTMATPDNARALNSSDLAETIGKYNINVTAHDSIKDAVSAALVDIESGIADMIIAFGSLSFLNELKNTYTDISEAEEGHNTARASTADGVDKNTNMNRVNTILNDETYRNYWHKTETLEKERIFCHHDMIHFLDVARIASLINEDEGLGLARDIIYAAALLHDIGRWQEYESGIAHELASAELAKDILIKCGYDMQETELICNAIKSHRDKSVRDNENLAGILYRADKLSRPCYACGVSGDCNKAMDKRNLYVRY